MQALAELRKLVSEQVTGSGGTAAVEALRAAIASQFEAVYVHADPSIPSGYYLEPRVRPELIDELTEKLALRPCSDYESLENPVGLERVPLGLGGMAQVNNVAGTGVPI